METFYQKAIEIIGTLPSSATWIYTITAILLFILACSIIIILLALVLGKVTRW